KAADAVVAEVDHEVGQSAAANDRTAASGRRTVIAVALLAILFAVGLAFLVVRSIVNPLKVVVERMAMLRDVCIAGLQEGIAAMAIGDLSEARLPHAPQMCD